MRSDGVRCTNTIRVLLIVSHKRKQPRRDGDPHVYRQPRIESEPSADHLTFRWRTNYMDYEGPFGWGSLSVHDFCRFVVAPLHQLETMAWGQVLGMKHNHTLTWSSVSSIAIHRWKNAPIIYRFLAKRLSFCRLGSEDANELLVCATADVFICCGGIPFIKYLRRIDSTLAVY